MHFATGNYTAISQSLWLAKSHKKPTVFIDLASELIPLFTTFYEIEQPHIS